MEVLIAMGVIVVGIAMALVSITMANKMADVSTKQVAAVHNARAVLEDLRQYAFADPVISVGTHSIKTNFSTTGNYIVSTINTNLKSVVVNVPWTNMMTRSSATATVSTIFSQALH